MFKNSIIIAIVAIVIGTFSINSNAQRPTPGTMGGLLGVGGSSSADLVEINGGKSYGRVTAYNGSHYELNVNDGSVIKSWLDSCQHVTSGTARGYQCAFTHFYQGQVKYSGYVMAFDNGYVYLRWLYTIQNNQSYANDTGWFGLMPKS